MTTTRLLIHNAWREGASGETLAIVDPATEEEIGTVAKAETTDLDAAVESTRQGFAAWRAVPPFERYRLLRRAAVLLGERAQAIAVAITAEEGKPLIEATREVLAAAETLDWFAEEARRGYGRVIPARAAGVQQIAIREPVGPVAAFSPWNFPVGQAAKKIGAALAAGCSIVLKGPEEAPTSVAALAQVFVDADLPAGVLNLLFGVPAEISAFLVAHPAIRKISFTGSTSVGKHLAALAGNHMKRATMELGGHAPAIVFADADLARATTFLGGSKYRNAGQICIAPSRFLVQEDVYDDFVGRLSAHARSLVIGDGRDAATTLGPMAHGRRVEAVEALVEDAVARGSRLVTGGKRHGNRGHFFEPSVLADVPTDARIMNEEPFGPVAAVVPFRTLDDALAEANRLPYGLACYVYSADERKAEAISEGVEAGMVTVNHPGLGAPEVPFGGVKDSGYGSEGGVEALDPYVNVKFVSRLFPA